MSNGAQLDLTLLETQSNHFLNGNPQTVFWDATYQHYLPFAKQNFALKYEGSPSLSMTTESTFTFKVVRLGDLLSQVFIHLRLPTIWSPIYPPQRMESEEGEEVFTDWAPYEFKWIQHLGAKIISKIAILCGGQTLQEYSGDYLLSAAQRDMTPGQLAKFYEMIGHTAVLNDPSNHPTQNKRLPSVVYPNAFFTSAPNKAQPSCPSRLLCIPLGAWFTLLDELSFPLICLQNNELSIQVTLTPVQQWFQIRDVQDFANGYPYLAPDMNREWMRFYRFLSSPPSVALLPEDYPDKRMIWDPELHLQCTYIKLTQEHREELVLTSPSYLVRQVRETVFYNTIGTQQVTLESINYVSSWMFYLQRNDVALRNEWSNYSNFPYAGQPPLDLVLAPALVEEDPLTVGPGVYMDGVETGLYITGDYSPLNEETILLSASLLYDGSLRENVQRREVFQYEEAYHSSPGQLPSGLYSYHFTLDTDLRTYQPHGAVCLTGCRQVQFQFVTLTPPFDPMAQTLTVCDPGTGQAIGVNKAMQNIFQYGYNLHVMEERVNMVMFRSGNAALLFAN